MVFRVTPSLGPDIEQVGPYYYDAAKGTDKNGATPATSYQIGSRVSASNGRDAVHALNGATPLVQQRASTWTQASWRRPMAPEPTIPLPQFRLTSRFMRLCLLSRAND